MNDPDGDCLTAGIDNCPLISNPGQDDADLDGSGDVCDCAPDDPSAYAEPATDIGLRWDSTILLRWTSLAAAAGPGIVYDLCQGDLGPDTMMSSDPVICLATASPGTTMDVPAAPVSGKAFYYFVRGSNTCWSASFGWGTEGNERPAAACE